MRVVRPLVAVFLGVLLFWGGLELGARALFSRVVAYDVEMWRYARELKVWGNTPGLRFEHRPAANTHLMGVPVNTNRDGLRDRDFPRQAAPGTVRIAALGDSITFGWGVPAAASYPKVLESLLRRAGVGDPVEVLNFGVGNYATVDEAAVLAQKVLGYEPDAVLLGVFINDAEEVAARRPNPILRHSLAAVWVWGRVDALLRRFGRRESYEAYYRSLYHPGRRGLEEMRDALQRIAESCRQRGIPWVVAMLPDLHRLKDYPFGEVHAWVRRQVESKGGIYVDLLPSLEQGDPMRYWVAPDDAHPNVDAHERYGRQLLGAVDWRGLLNGPGTPKVD